MVSLSNHDGHSIPQQTRMTSLSVVTHFTDPSW